MKYYELFEKLECMNGRKIKEEIIKNHESPFLLDIFDRTFNPYKQTYINKIKDVKFGTVKEFDDIISLFDTLTSRKITGYEAKKTVWEYMKLQPELKRKWDIRILLKDLKIGISGKTINKIFGKYIPLFEVMLCKKVENIDKLIFPLIAQPKLDGIRCLKIGDSLISRSGKAIANEKLYEHLKDIIKHTDFVFDGELYSHTVTFNDILSNINSEDKDLDLSIRYVIYDLISKKEWDNAESEAGYNDRIAHIKLLIKDARNCEIIEGKIVNDRSELNNYYNRCLDYGYEGIMVKNPHGRYQWKRVDQTIMSKIKPTESHDLKIIDFKEGEGRHEKSLGALVCDFNGVTVFVGGGYSDDERRQLWNNKTDLVGKWIEVQAQEVTKDGSLRFPVFGRIRDDK